MKRFHTALGLSPFLAIAGVILMAPTTSSAQTVESSYVACNQDHECWRVHRLYAYGPDRPITYYKSDWYDAHQNDEHIRWLSDLPMTVDIMWKGVGMRIPARAP